MTVSLKNRSSSSLSTTSSSVVDYNASRSLLLIQNCSTSHKVAFSFSGAAQINGVGSITLSPGETVEWRGPLTPDNSIQAITENDLSPNLTIYEG